MGDLEGIRPNMVETQGLHIGSRRIMAIMVNFFCRTLLKKASPGRRGIIEDGRLEKIYRKELALQIR